MKKRWFFLLLLVLVLTAGTVGAEERNNPDRQEAMAVEKLTQELCAQLHGSGGSVQANGSSGLHVTCKREPSMNGTGSWTIALTGRSASQVQRMTCYLGYKDWSSDYTHVHWIDKNRDKGDTSPFMSSYTTPKFVTSGSYILGFYVYFTDNPGSLGAWYVYEFTLSGTNALQNKIKSVASSCKGSTQWNTALNLHDWLTHNMYYDLDLEFYGADSILRGYGVCDSYSKIYLMLCSEAGIPVRRVTNNGHAWNAVRLGGKWYYVDCTWDDPSGVKQKVSGSERYTYFCLNSTLLALDHPKPWTWAHSSAQTCSSLDANYYVHTGKWKLWGDYGWNNTGETVVNTLSQQIQNAFDNGETSFVISLGEGSTLWYMENGSCKGFYVTGREKAILDYALPGEYFWLDGESVRIVTKAAASTITVKISGWNITETGTLKLPAGLKLVPERAFQGNAATTLIIQSGCTEIGAGAFMNSGIRLATIPASVTKIADDAFAGCGKLLFKTSCSAAEEYAAKHGITVIDP